MSICIRCGHKVIFNRKACEFCAKNRKRKILEHICEQIEIENKDPNFIASSDLVFGVFGLYKIIEEEWEFFFQLYSRTMAQGFGKQL